MSNNVDARKLGAFAVIAACILVAIYTGGLIVDNNIGDLLYIVIGAVIIYLTVTSQNWLQYCFIAISFGFIATPLGFKIGAFELSGLFIACFLLKHAWIHGSLGIPNSLKFGYTLIYSTSILVLYLTFHTIFNILYPYNGETIHLSNILKTITQIASPFIIIAFSLISFNKTKLPENLYRFICIILILAMVSNIIIQIYSMLYFDFTLFEEDEKSLDQSTEKSGFSIPFINITNNIYQLRVLAPIGVALSLMILLAKNTNNTLKGTTFYAKILLIISFISAIFSGGRATIILSTLFALLILVKRQLFSRALFIIFALFIILVCIKILNDTNSKIIPQSVQRALAPLSFLGFEKASDSINSSTNWRNELRDLSYKDWLQSTRTFLFGRSVYAFTETDVILQIKEGYYGTMTVSLRRGATHNLVTDLLVPFGLVGLSLYALCVFSIFRKIIYIRDVFSKKSHIVADLSNLLIMLIPVYIFMGVLGGVGFSFELGCLMAFMLVYVGKIDPVDKVVVQARR